MTDEPEWDIEATYCSLLVDQALRAVPGTAERVWRAAAAGELSIQDCQLWVEQVADMVVHQILDAKPSGYERGGRALMALGLEGRQDELWTQRNHLHGWLAFDDLDDPSHKPTRLEMLSFMRDAGYLLDVDDQDALKRIDRLLRDKRHS